MQKFCIWETGYKIPKIDCIKLRCKNFASGKLDTKYLKLTASSYSLSQSTINSIGREKESTRREKKSVCFKCPYHSCIFVWDCRFITWMTVRSKKRERKKRKKETRFLHVKFNTGRKNKFTSIADLEQTICKCHICLILLNFAPWRRTKFAIILH